MKMLRLLVLFALLPLPLFANADPVEVAHSLAHQNLIYKYGADDPSTGGLDCSGFMMVAFKQSWNINLPDQAGKQFEYIRQNGEVWDATTSFWTQKTLKPWRSYFLDRDVQMQPSLPSHSCHDVPWEQYHGGRPKSREAN